VAAALDVDAEEWKAEIPLIEEWFDRIGQKLPTSMRDELEASGAPVIERVRRVDEPEKMNALLAKLVVSDGEGSSRIARRRVSPLRFGRW